ncbi:MAG: HlyD family efflux transporter periplasmic adaptor subunit [Terrimicrobiaceae bacterium]
MGLDPSNWILVGRWLTLPKHGTQKVTANHALLSILRLALERMETSELHPSQVRQDNRLKWQSFLLSRSVRLGVFGAFLFMVFIALGLRILTTSSIKGVVNAPILLIRSPIDGTITMVALRPGETISQGQNLFQIENARFDTSNLDRLRSEKERSKAAMSGLKILLQEYTQKRDALESRLKDHLEATKNSIAQKLNEATQQQTQAAEAETQASRDMPRQKTLAEKGANARMRWTQARNEKNAWQAVAERNVAELDANGEGILLAGYSETPYARQRMDELDIRLSETKAKLDQEQNLQAALEKELEGEQSRTIKLSEATIVSPSLSLVQSLRVSKGSDVVKGAVLCELIDCNNSYVEASIPEKDFDSVKLGQKAAVYLYGNHNPIPGVVISVRGAGAYNASNAEESAAMLNRTTPDSMIVSVSINAEDLIKTFGSANQVGRTARIVLSKN